MTPEGSHRSKAVEWTLAAVIVTAAAAFVVVIIWDCYFRLSMHDFGLTWESTRAYLVGRGLYDPVQPRVPGFAGLNLTPPPAHVLYLPFAWLSAPAAFALWWLVQFAALIVAGRVVCRQLGIRPGLDPLAAAFVLAALAVSGPAFSGWFTAQPVGLITLAGTAVWVSERRRRETALGASTAVLVAMKPAFAAVIVVMFVGSRWRALAAGALTGLAAIGVGLLCFGTDSYVVWGEQLRRVNFYPQWQNASIVGMATRVFEGGQNFAPVIEAAWIRMACTLSLTVTVLFAIMRRTRGQDPDAWCAASLIGSVLLSPLGWLYYLPAAVGPVAALVRRNGASPLAWAAAAGLWFPPVLIFAGQPSGLASATVGSVYAWGLLALLGWIPRRDSMACCTQHGDAV